MYTADTENNTLVRNYIVSTLRALDWHVEEDSFIDNTPYGPKNFTNVIATKDPEAPRRVALSAHFDSKFFSSYPQNQVRVEDFVGPLCLAFRGVRERCLGEGSVALSDVAPISCLAVIATTAFRCPPATHPSISLQ